MSRKRFQARRRNGRFTRNTLSNTFGLNVLVCASCRGFNVVPHGEARPKKCQHCDEPLVDISETDQ